MSLNSQKNNVYPPNQWRKRKFLPQIVRPYEWKLWIVIGFPLRLCSFSLYVCIFEKKKIRFLIQFPKFASPKSLMNFLQTPAFNDRWYANLRKMRVQNTEAPYCSIHFFFFYKHAVYKHARLKLAKKLSTLLSTPQAEIWRKNLFFYNFPVLLPSKCRKNNYFSYFFKEMS